ncbi:hypothetical protein SPHINGO391_210036 [Sphingomonas aurantiaca]|uniref:Uncharacterized protein n=1 Tax=Sphingomonas aurantiaca TaxID=185949 RepID=A0A5E7XU91_9SPHN|nr:hypothetical protein SPHINGO391_210036 [Sphingomonas aurantiaca]
MLQAGRSRQVGGAVHRGAEFARQHLLQDQRGHTFRMASLVNRSDVRSSRRRNREVGATLDACLEQQALDQRRVWVGSSRVVMWQLHNT